MKLCAVVSLSLMLALAGCSGEKKEDKEKSGEKPGDKAPPSNGTGKNPLTVDVKGTVTVNNKPLPLGKITFVPRKGNSVTGEVQDGQFSLAGVSIGDNKVAVDTSHIAVDLSRLPSRKARLGELREHARQPG